MCHLVPGPCPEVVVVFYIRPAEVLTLFSVEGEAQVERRNTVVGFLTPKAICSKPNQHAQMLMGYIPTTWLKSIKNKAAQQQALANLFHSCMHKVFSPIETYGETSIAMATGNGIWYHCHPILATFIGDYPEQTLVMCTLNGRCLKCLVLRDEIGSNTRFPSCNFTAAVNAFSLSDGDPTAFHAACRNASLKPTYHLFWEQLPFSNIFLLILPDILHQLHQGILKHVPRLNLTRLTCAAAVYC